MRLTVPVVRTPGGAPAPAEPRGTLVLRVRRLVQSPYVWLLWLLTRTYGLVALAAYPAVSHDVTLYARWADRLQSGLVPYRDFPVEYPPGILPLLGLPADDPSAYRQLFFASAVVADGLLLALLDRRGTRWRGAALWLCAPLLVGPLLWSRLDVFVALTLVIAVRASRAGRWGLCGSALAAAGLLKLWPVAVVALLLVALDASARLRLLAGAAVTGLVGVAPVLLTGGGQGLVWMLAYHRERGLEVEALAATPLHVARLLGEHVPVVQAHGAYEFTPATSGLLLPVTTVLTVAGLALCALHAWRRRGAPTLTGELVLLVALCMLAGSKVLSAQYAVWVAAAVAVALDDLPRRRALMMLTGALLLTTQYVFPFTFPELLAGEPIGVLAVLLHSLVVAVLCVAAWRGLAAGLERATGRDPVTSSVRLPRLEPAR